MNPPSFLLNARAPLLALAFALLCASCATQPQTERPTRDTAERDRFTMAGFELKSKGQTRQDVVARYGPPLSETTAGRSNEYQILAYPIVGEPAKVLMIFFQNELLAVTREPPDGSQFVEQTIRTHARHQEGKVVLYQAGYEGGQTVRFSATAEQLARVPKWKPGDPSNPPLSELQAETLASEWLRRTAPDVPGISKVRQVHEIRSRPGTSFYEVTMGGPFSPPHLRKLVVLMDGTVIAGELDK